MASISVIAGITLMWYRNGSIRLSASDTPMPGSMPMNMPIAMPTNSSPIASGVSSCEKPENRSCVIGTRSRGPGAAPAGGLPGHAEADPGG